MQPDAKEFWWRTNLYLHLFELSYGEEAGHGHAHPLK